MAYCDFCTCSDCVNGNSMLQHALCVDGRWICSTCYVYDVCTCTSYDGIVPRSMNGPCDAMECVHRPKLVIPPRFID